MHKAVNFSQENLSDRIINIVKYFPFNFRS